MPSFDVDRERLNVFEIGDEYRFAEYFDRTDLFEDLSEYYVDDVYRFEIPAEEFPDVRERLEDAYYDPVVVSDLEAYCVVIEQYEKHAEILKLSVANWECSGHRFFLMRSEFAVEKALQRGATRIEETEFVVGL